MPIPAISRKGSHTGTTFFDILNDDPDEILENEKDTSYQEPQDCVHKPRKTRFQRYKLFLVCAAWFIVTSVVGGNLFYYSSRMDRQSMQEKLASNCQQSTNILKSTLSRLINDLSNHAYFVSSVGQGMTYEMFSTFTSYATKDSLKYALAWQPQVKQHEREEWEAQNGINITIVQETSSMLLKTPSPMQPYYYPILYGVMYDTEHIGIDVLQTNRSDTILKALGTLKTAVSPISEFKLMGFDGIRIYLPVLVNLYLTDKGDYSTFRNNHTKVHENVLGLVSLSVSIQNILTNAINISDGNYIRIIDKTGNDYMIYSNNGKEELPGDIFEYREELSFGDREWHISCYSPPLPFFPSKTKSSLFFAIILCTIFSTIILFILTKKYLKAKELVSIRSKMLQDSNALVTDMATNSKAILMSITDPLLLFNRDGKITGANAYALSRTGYTSDDISSSSELAIKDVINIAQWTGSVTRLVIEPGMREVTITCKNGSQFFAEANFSAQTVIGSNYAQVVTFRDISAKKQAAIDLWNAKNKAEKADKSKGDILLYLCHEIRNPVHAIGGYARLLMEQMEDEDEPSEEMENILCSSKFLSELVNEVLDLANLHDNDLVLNERTISLAELLATINHLTSPMEGSKYQLTSTLTGSGQVRVVCDPSALQLVIHRLGCLLSDSTSIDDHEEALMRVDVVLVKEDAECAIIKYLIQCPNKVIPSHYLAVDFDPLAQGNGSMGDQFGMKGISLTLTRIMIQKLGGKLISTSDTRIGTQFSFELQFKRSPDHPSSSSSSRPLHHTSQRALWMRIQALQRASHILRGQPPSSGPAHQRSPARRGNRSSHAQNQTRTGPAITEKSSRLLTKNGYDVTTANNGLEAVEAVERSPDYDIALLDIHMPLMGGLEAGRAMRERLGFQDR
ncbi:hypothetical protein K493DRAFT_296463 [Basidiobolus meristosporus CBS 931.73]|uniref:Uncharacterized protein n=1 Tax=Basidiobolus meristosporus CBS 931.73 TaxID=1314790 RepID=A0A1Y1Z588_9FUNG|nr:hypothetical protein K493DRAFT_296463 [Basidiobolus meristosporus CBS 931.73]|eukprot:ORY05410.1 hypothetical protein K493DRAFT_296463 [Basidiobolus meristosporus CBS 931.73]